MSDPVDIDRESLDCLYRIAIALESINRYLSHVVQTVDRLEAAEIAEVEE